MTLTRKQPKQRKCKVCKELFTPHLPMARELVEQRGEG